MVVLDHGHVELARQAEEGEAGEHGHRQPVGVEPTVASLAAAGRRLRLR